MGHSDTHRTLHDHFNTRRFEQIEPHLAPGYLYEDLPRALTIKTAGEFTDWLKAWADAFSDGQISSAQYVEGPEHSVAMYHGRGTNDGPIGAFAPTGRSADVPFCEILHYASDGRVLSGEVYYDQLTLLAQLGLVSPPGAAADSLEPTVRTLMKAFDAMDAETISALSTDDAQGVDEISRAWMRGRDAMNDYLGSLKGMVSDIHSEITDIRESITGDIGTLTCWLEQDYQAQGKAVHVSAPTTVVLRRMGDEWKVCLIHSVPLPDAG